MAEVKGSRVPRIPAIADSATSRAVGELALSLRTLNSNPTNLGVLVPVSVAAPGPVTLTHALGRPPLGCMVALLKSAQPDTPTVTASSSTSITVTFHYALTGTLLVF